MVQKIKNMSSHPMNDKELERYKKFKFNCEKFGINPKDSAAKEKLRKKAKKYIKENKIGKLKKTTDVSFINLNATADSENFKILSHVELGDTITYTIKVSDLYAESQTNVIQQQAFEYIVNQAILQWLLLAFPSKAEMFATNCGTLEFTIKQAINKRLKPTER